MRRTIATSLVILLIGVTLSACGGNNIDGTWVPADGETSGFASVIFDGNNINIPGVTVSVPGMGISFTYAISGDELIVTTSGGGVSMEMFRFSFRQESNSIFLDSVEYVRQ